MSSRRFLSLAVLLVITAIAILGLASCKPQECDHTYGEWKITTPATCTSEGERTRECTACEQTETEKINKTAHSFKDATCTEAKKCTVCGLTEGEAIAHTWLDATCTEAKKCTVCGLTEGEANGHTWLDATCTDPKTCSVCGATEGEALGGEGHRGGEATCTEGAVCEICGAEYLSATGHAWGNGEVLDELTCTEDGSVKYTCTVCAEVKTETTTAPGHVLKTKRT